MTETQATTTKDWTGNGKSLFTTNGDSNHSNRVRETSDYYATDPKAVEQLLEMERFSDAIWEPACGEGHISKVLQRNGHYVRSTDLVDRGFGEGNIDFLKQYMPWGGYRHQSAVQACEGIRGTRIGASARRQQALHVPQADLSGRSGKTGVIQKISTRPDMGVGSQAGMSHERHIHQRQRLGRMLRMVHMGERV